MRYNSGMEQRNDEKTRRILASNITFYRKKAGLTQDELAERIFYSGKSVSKWERGEGVPDALVLASLSETLGVTPNDLLLENTKPTRVRHRLKKGLITAMALAAVWLVATMVYFFIRITAPDFEKAWLAFIVAIPVSCIVAIVLTALWHPRIWTFIAISGLVWSLALTLHLFFRIENMFLIYVIAAVLQLIIVLWYLLLNANKLPSIKLPIGRKKKPAEQVWAEEKPEE